VPARYGDPPAEALPWRVQRTPPAAGTRLLALSEIPDGGCVEWRSPPGQGLASLLLQRAGQGVQAYVNVCPHLGLPLNGRSGEFLLLGPDRLQCAYHCAVFRLADGQCIEGPAVGFALDAVPVEVVAGVVHVAIP